MKSPWSGAPFSSFAMDMLCHSFACYAYDSKGAWCWYCCLCYQLSIMFQCVEVILSFCPFPFELLFTIHSLLPFSIFIPFHWILTHKCMFCAMSFGKLSLQVKHQWNLCWTFSAYLRGMHVAVPFKITHINVIFKKRH